MDGSGEFFAEFAAALSPEVEPIVVSYPAAELGYGELTAHARKSLPDRPYVLVGESFSGPIAISIAASAPPGLLGVVLVCSFARSPLPWFSRLLPFAPPVWRMPQSIVARVLLGRFSTPRYSRLLAASIQKIPPAVWRARLRAVRDVDVTAQLKQIKVPLLYLRASRDRVVPRAASEWLLRNTKDAAVADLDGPHFLLQARPHEAATRVKDFARRIAARA